MESTDSSAPSVGFGSVVPSDTESPTSSTFSSKSKAEPEPETLEKRKRLAAFLDQTAKAMEGGRSLAMVLPEVRATDSEPAKSMSELAESISPRLPSAIEYRHPFASSFAAPSICVASDAGSPSPKAGSRSPRDRSQSPRGSRVEFALPTTAGSSPATPTAPSVARARSPVNSQNRHTVYFTPDPSSAGSDDGNESDASEQAGGTSGREADVSATPSLTRNGSTGGLGFNIDIDTQSTLSNIRPGPADRSPSTLHAESPVVSLRPSFETAPAISAEVAQAMEKRAKIAEKRKRTIRELIDTEASYATDMIVVRDIYLARAKGVGESLLALLLRRFEALTLSSALDRHRHDRRSRYGLRPRTRQHPFLPSTSLAYSQHSRLACSVRQRSCPRSHARRASAIFHCTLRRSPSIVRSIFLC